VLVVDYEGGADVVREPWPPAGERRLYRAAKSDRVPRALAKPPRALVGFGYRAADGALAHVVGFRLHDGDALLVELRGAARLVPLADVRAAMIRAGKECEIPNFKGSSLGRFPLVSADFWTSDHLLERPRSVDDFSGTRARGTLTLKRTLITLFLPRR